MESENHFYAKNSILLPSFAIAPETLVDQAKATLNMARQKDVDLLGPMLVYAPTLQGKRTIAKWILEVRRMQEGNYKSLIATLGLKQMTTNTEQLKEDGLNCHRDVEEALGALAEHYRNTLIKPILGIKGKASRNPAWPADYNLLEAKSCSRSGDREKLMKRDHYTCLLTGRFDVTLAKVPDAECVKYWTTVKDKSPTGIVVGESLQAAHIIPYSLNNFKKNDSEMRERHRIIWTTLADFSGDEIDLPALKGTEINKSANMMMLCPCAHGLFDDLQLSFSAPEKNAGDGSMCKVNLYTSSAKLADILPNELVTIHPDVNRNWLALHHAIFQVAWQSGYTDSVELDNEIQQIYNDDDYDEI